MKPVRYGVCALFLFLSIPLRAADYPAPKSGNFILKDFKFQSGASLPELRIHYWTIGNARKDATGKVSNAVLVLHGTGGSGENFLNDNFAGVLFSPGGLLDARRYFIILPDGIGHGGSSKPSDGLKGKFPRYGYQDMVTAQYRLLTEGLAVGHLRLLMGTAMGGMHTWIWGSNYPKFADALFPLASLPVQISGRNRGWRKMAIDAIRKDQHYENGAYTAQPEGLTFALNMLWLMSSSPTQRQRDAPTRDTADKAVDEFLAQRLKTTDANDLLYALDASYDYDPQPKLPRIHAPLVAVNFADDLINPPELGIMEREIKRLPRGKAVLIPAGPNTRGHGTHSWPIAYQGHLAALLKQTEKEYDD